MAAHDASHSLGYLLTRDDVDEKHIYCVGMGDMGVTALLTGICDARVAAVAADDFGITYRQGREKPLLPHLLRYGDLPQVAALYAPKPLLLNRATPTEQFSFTSDAYKALNGRVALLLLKMEPHSARKAIAVWLAELAGKGK